MNFKLIDFTIKSLKRRLIKKLSVIFIFSLLVFLLVSVFSISSSIKKELQISVEALPEIIVQKMSGGRQVLIPVDRAYEIATIPGVQNAYDRVWGYYYFVNKNVNFTVVGLDFDLEIYKQKYSDVINLYAEATDTINTPFMIVGSGVHKMLEENFYKNFYTFRKVTGGELETKIVGSFTDISAMETNDVILMPVNYVRELFDISENYATDIVVRIPNPEEIETVKQKLNSIYPDCRIVSRSDIEASYQNIFDYKSGLFLVLLITAFVAFFILVYDNASGLSIEDRREIGILKAVGWQVENILQIKFIEGGLISLFSFFAGTGLAFFYVYILQAPILRNIFTGASNLKPTFNLIPVVNVEMLTLIFILTVPIYILATIIPAWKSSVIDADEVMR